MKKLVLFFLLLGTLALAGCLPQTSTVPAVTEPPLPGATPTLVTVPVYFTDSNRFATGTEPYEVAVMRVVPAEQSNPEYVIQQYFLGPSQEEQAQGLTAITSGFTGLRQLIVQDGVAHVYLEGACSSGGASYTIAAPLMRNLRQFEGIDFIKIYDAEGGTEQPQGLTDSIPFCLEP